jgi:hypothetical protein
MLIDVKRVFVNVYSTPHISMSPLPRLITTRTPSSDAINCCHSLFDLLTLLPIQTLLYGRLDFAHNVGFLPQYFGPIRE